MIKKFRICQATKDKNVAIIVYEEKNYAEGFVITHNPTKLKDTFHKLHKNPNPLDNKDSFLVHRLRKGEIGNGKLFSIIELLGYKLSEEDDLEITLIYKAKKNKMPWNFFKQKRLPYRGNP